MDGDPEGVEFQRARLVCVDAHGASTHYTEGQDGLKVPADIRDPSE